MEESDKFYVVHTHPDMEKRLKVEPGHVIIDEDLFFFLRNNWLEIRKFLSFNIKKTLKPDTPNKYEVVEYSLTKKELLDKLCKIRDDGHSLLFVIPLGLRINEVGDWIIAYE